MSFQPIAIEVKNLWIRKGGGLFGQAKSILQDVSFTVMPGEFVAVVGPNGAGKTTMVKSVVGEKPAYGEIRFRQGDEAFENLYDNPEYWLRKIGYVPVDNVLHDDLTIRQALRHIGQLRLPELSEAEVEARVLEKLKSFGFEETDPRLDQLLKSLSSGEKKKVNIATELLTNPPLLLLDEPTSNLDPNAERDLMDNLRSISGAHTDGQGPTILLITHTLESLNRCDKVVFIANSCLKIYGTPQEVFQTLEAQLPAGLLATDANQFEIWAEIFELHKTDEVIAQRITRVPPPIQKLTPAPTRATYQDSFWRQFRILFRRYYNLRVNDLNGIFALLISGFVVGFLMLVAPPEVFLRPDSGDATAARQTVVLYTILVVIMGAFIGHREISKEFHIYLHERTKGLSPLAYVTTKGLWLTLLIGVIVTEIILALSGFAIARAVVLVLGLVIGVIGLVYIVRDAPAPGRQRGKQIIQLILLMAPLLGAYAVQLQLKQLPSTPVNVPVVEITVTISLIFASVAALALGLLVSALVGRNNDRATQLAIAAILINVVLAFAALVIGTRDVQELFNRLEPFAATHWGYRGFASGISIYCWAGRTPFENFNSWGHLGMTWILLVVHVIVIVALTVFALRMQETWMSSTRKLRSVLVTPGTYVTVGLVACLLSWAMFLSARSTEYYTLTYYDRLDGRNRYARVENVNAASPLQIIDGVISQSACGVDQVLPSSGTQSQLSMLLEGSGS